MNSHRLLNGLFSLGVALALLPGGAKADADVSTATARTSPDWLRSGTIYEIYPARFLRRRQPQRRHRQARRFAQTSA